MIESRRLFEPWLAAPATLMQFAIAGIVGGLLISAAHSIIDPAGTRSPDQPVGREHQILEPLIRIDDLAGAVVVDEEGSPVGTIMGREAAERVLIVRWQHDQVYALPAAQLRLRYVNHGLQMVVTDAGKRAIDQAAPGGLAR